MLPTTILYLFILFHSFYCQLLEKSRSVWVEQGLVRGKIYNIDGRHIQIFRGIPYAEPPIGDLRFRKPVKKARWHQELSAVDYGPPCLQFMEFHKNDKFAGKNMLRESEDCLYLNVFSPYDNEDEAKLFPIIVWIHGGSFLAGSADTGIDMEVVARNLVFKGVTLVTINYRLGPLGFININDGQKIEGNYGIWDMVMALQWIQANIKQFNGDPSRVTVMGESAGAAAASLLALSPRTEGLIHQAIILSGSSLAGWAIHRHGNPSWSVENIAAYLRCEKTISDEDADEIVGEEYTSDEIKSKKCNYQDQKIPCLTPDLSVNQQLDCLRKELNLSSTLLRKALSIELGVSKMIVDGDLVPTSGPALTQYARIPILTGVARKEWAHKKPQFYNLHRKTDMTAEESAESVFRIVEGSFHCTSSQKLTNATLHLIANASFVRYIDDPTNTFATSRVVSALQEMEADIEFVAPCQREVDGYAENNVTVYAYSFDYIPESPIYEEEKKVVGMFGKEPIIILRKDMDFEDRKLEAFHGLDHAFIFSKGYSSNFEIRPYTKRDEAMSKILTNMLTNFVKTGNPSTTRFDWPAFTLNSSKHACINNPPKLMNGQIHWPNPKFWNIEAELISKYVPKDMEAAVDPDAELSNEERVQLSAYRRAWWALWILVVFLAIIIWGIIIYCIIKNGSTSSNNKYDNIVLTR
ncbi:unnamed protein product [Auanema sp. JU1783]|nr:unnamed protein product [Auanema sp. JU1783]